MSAAVSGLLTM